MMCFIGLWLYCYFWWIHTRYMNAYISLALVELYDISLKSFIPGRFEWSSLCQKYFWPLAIPASGQFRCAGPNQIFTGPNTWQTSDTSSWIQWMLSTNFIITKFLQDSRASGSYLPNYPTGNLLAIGVRPVLISQTDEVILKLTSVIDSGDISSESLLKLHLDDCRWYLLMISQYWFR